MTKGKARMEMFLIFVKAIRSIFFNLFMLSLGFVLGFGFHGRFHGKFSHKKAPVAEFAEIRGEQADGTSGTNRITQVLSEENGK